VEAPPHTPLEELTVLPQIPLLQLDLMGLLLRKGAGRRGGKGKRGGDLLLTEGWLGSRVVSVLN